MHFATLDVGGTALKYALFSDETLLYSGETPSRAKEGVEAMLEAMYGAIDGMVQHGPISGIGISTAGQVDALNGVIVYANETMPGYRGTHLSSVMHERYHIPAFVENDVDAAALGEARFGAGRGLKDFLCLTFGTGVGGAIISSGQLYRGQRGVAAEFGHILTHPGGRLCSCGHQGCYQQYASVSALLENAKAARLPWKDGHSLCRAYHSGDPDAKALLDSWIVEISYGLISLIHIFAPDTILIGGGISAEPVIAHSLQEHIRKGVVDTFLPVTLRQMQLGNLAGVHGMLSVLLESSLHEA